MYRKKYDMEEESAAILEWAKKEDSINLNGYCIERQHPAEYISVFCKRSKEFDFYCGLALCYLAVRREKLVSAGKLYQGTWMRNASVYDRLLRYHEREQKQYESDLRIGEKEKDSINLSDLITTLTSGEKRKEMVE